MQGKITAGGRLSIVLYVGFAMAWATVIHAYQSDGVTEIAFGLAIILSCPVGLLNSDLTTNGPGSSSPLVFLIWAAGNCFLLGYGLTGIWRFLRRCFAPTFQ